MIAGKGHEQGQETAGVVTPFDDRVVAREALRAGFGDRRARDPAWSGTSRGARARRARAAPPADARRSAAIKADSRVVGPGDLFVALNTGVEHVADAAARGAATLVPDDQEAALAALASLVRSKSDARVVAVVGSTGRRRRRTSSARSAAPPRPTVWAEASQNNEIGLPLTVCRLEPETEVLVTEMGMRGLGQIAALCAIARPDVAVVTSIGPEHLELVGTVERVAEANAEAIVALPPGGIAVVPADAPELEPHLGRTDIEIRRFDRAAVEGDGHEWRFPLAGGVRRAHADVPFTARHMAENTLAALVAYDALGLPLDAGPGRRRRDQALALARARSAARPAAGSSSTTPTTRTRPRCGLRSSISSQRAGDRRRVAILGEMAELGAASPPTTRRSGACSTSSGSSS